MKPLVRWTVGNVRSEGYESLFRSIVSFRRLYDVDVVICYNGHSPIVGINSINQEVHKSRSIVNPKGVAWKLVPPRIDLNRHELFIDNDLIIEEKIPQIDQFFAGNSTLLLEGCGRMYGRFENHVPKGFDINSGIFGIPPNFDFSSYLQFYGSNWENNAAGIHAKNYTFDEQGFVATTLLSQNHLIIPKEIITNCEDQLNRSKGMHFVGLNRRIRHEPWLKYKLLLT